ncbi:MAG: biosynthetic peptidoglycan transglycosylase [Gemmatimonadota bacterium]|nr:biosynthetic peptidoglycan transglycosylase [Gemmatimonadota bacterium]
MEDGETGTAAPASAPRERLRRTLRRGFGWSLLLLGLGGLALHFSLPDTSSLVRGWPERTAYMRAWAESRVAEGALRYTPVPLERIPASVRRAVLVSEDAAFYGHRGFDWHEVRAALREAWEEREAPRGASTITQQLARNLYLSPARTPLRKLREALIARRLERSLTKDRILELYLNVAELGPGIYGVEEAARRYWDIPVREVSRRQAAELAATLPSPRRANPATRPRDFVRRAELAYARAFGEAPGPDSSVTETVPGPSDTVMEPVAPAADTTGAPTDSMEAEPAPPPDSIPEPPAAEAVGSALDTTRTRHR